MEYVTLANGKKVEWDEFCQWSAVKQHQSLKPPNKGRQFSEEFKEKIRQARKNEILNGTRKIIKGGEHSNARRVSTPNGVFETLKEAAISYKVTTLTIRKWIKSGKEGFVFNSPPRVRSLPSKKDNLSGSSNGSARAVITPSGRFGTLKEAALFLGIGTKRLTNIIKKSSNGDYRYESERCATRVNPNSIRIMTPADEFETFTSAPSIY